MSEWFVDSDRAPIDWATARDVGGYMTIDAWRIVQIGTGPPLRFRWGRVGHPVSDFEYDRAERVASSDPVPEEPVPPAGSSGGGGLKINFDVNGNDYTGGLWQGFGPAFQSPSPPTTPDQIVLVEDDNYYDGSTWSDAPRTAHINAEGNMVIEKSGMYNLIVKGSVTSVGDDDEYRIEVKVIQDGQATTIEHLLSTEGFAAGAVNSTQQVLYDGKNAGPVNRNRHGLLMPMVASTVIETRAHTTLGGIANATATVDVIPVLT